MNERHSRREETAILSGQPNVISIRFYKSRGISANTLIPAEIACFGLILCIKTLFLSENAFGSFGRIFSFKNLVNSVFPSNIRFGCPLAIFVPHVI